MFGPQYIFETRGTRTLRYTRNAFILLFTFFFIYLICGYFFVLFSANENDRSQQRFFKDSPDLIVIFTGQSGRIPYGMSLAKKFDQSNIFITGVYEKNSVQTLLAPLELEDKIDHNLLEIDYYARNTVENCISTLRYLREKKGFKNILVISHDYHIPRIKTIFHSIMADDDHFELFYSGVSSDYTDWKNLKILYTEVYKYIRTYAFLMIWDTSEYSL
ncbi:MAG: hypothetical protein CME63_13350 [Halobacteriovoraceae bacterium]|nr:hypothetical protein [Halobacteriovoraceae bacterium]|tara:strand:- start:7771 stop:8421 length:651 start_codon:yes stop_codon:yes gene_type:complete